MNRINRSRIALLLLLLALIVTVFSKQPTIAIGPRATGFLYGATAGSNLGGELVRIDPATGAVTRVVGPLVDAIGNQYGVTGLAFSESGVLYGSTSNNSETAPRSLVTIDLFTARVTLIGPFGAGPKNTMADLTVDPTSGKLYGAGSFGADLYTINQTTGAATIVGASGFSLTLGSGLAANGSGTIYGAPLGSSGDLVTYDTMTGTPSTAAILTNAPFPEGSIGAMAFSGSTLFGVNIDLTNAITRPSHLVTIDTSTAVVSDVGASIDYLDALALATTRVSENLCKQNGWRSLTRADGSTFKNQGDCIQYVNTGK